MLMQSDSDLSEACERMSCWTLTFGVKHAQPLVLTLIKWTDRPLLATELGLS